MFHALPSELVEQYTLPESFTNPFDYTPHPLVSYAAKQVASWIEPLDEGKMFGVLIVERGVQVGFVAGFSGMLQGSYSHPLFAPAIMDIEQSNSYLEGQQKLREIAQKIEDCTTDSAYTSLLQQVERLKKEAESSILAAREEYNRAKQLRSEQRVGADAERLRELSGESSAQKRKIKALRAQWQDRVTSSEREVRRYSEQIEALKRERSALSQSSQESIFKEFTIHNALGEQESLYSIFQRVTSQFPPSGAGECAAPKMVEYAYSNGFTPRAMGEFWLGESPRCEPRSAGEFYTSCSGKCSPILGFMLQGLPLEQSQEQELPEPVILFEDEYIIAFDKPSGMLSVKGKVSKPSLDEYMEGLHTVHRLDMDTSGVIIFAKSREVKVALQRQFEERSTEKSYVALCRGEVSPLEGVISLPLRTDIDDRPRQVVDYTHGKEATTLYRVVAYKDGVSRVLFHPVTGRTHQLRVHAAHACGLAAPIVGDRLYGRGSSRLHLHAQSLSLRHPITGRHMTIMAESPF